MSKLRSTEPHYIRCLKPNQTLKAGDWDNEFMFRQLSYSGTLEVTEIRKAGLNVRKPLRERLAAHGASVGEAPVSAAERSTPIFVD